METCPTDYRDYLCFISISSHLRICPCTYLFQHAIIDGYITATCNDINPRVLVRDAPNMLKNLPIIPSRTSQNLSLLFFKIPPIIPKLFRSNSKYIIATAN